MRKISVFFAGAYLTRAIIATISCNNHPTAARAFGLRRPQEPTVQELFTSTDFSSLGWGDLALIWLRTIVQQSIGYFTLVGVLFLLLWRWGAPKLRRFRIQEKQRFDAAQWRHEMMYTFSTLTVGSLHAFSLLFLYQSGHSKIAMDTSNWQLWELIVSGVVMILLNDLWFYSMHRFLHRPTPFRLIHSIHHKSIDVNPFSSYSFHIVEALLVTCWMIPYVMFVPTPMAVLGFLQVFGLANNIMSHLGYEFLPAWLLKIPVLRWLNTSTFHNMHHTRIAGNYALHFRWLDRFFGTELSGYDAMFTKSSTKHEG